MTNETKIQNPTSLNLKQQLSTIFIFCEIWNGWQPYLDEMEFKIVMFIYYRTIIFGKYEEDIAIRHFCEGVYKTGTEELYTAGIGKSQRTIKRYLSALEAYGAISRKVTPGRFTTYKLNLDLEPHLLVNNKVEYYQAQGKNPTFLLDSPDYQRMKKRDKKMERTANEVCQ